MLHRQRVILEFLRLADRPVTHLELTKWSFLLRHETESAGGSAFYDFLPYKYGPFSFSLFQELGKLTATSYVVDNDKSLRLGDAAGGLPPLGGRITDDLLRVLRRVGRHGRSQLIDYVYSNHPAYTCNSEIKRLAERPVAEPKVYTAGYESRSIDAFLDMLVKAGVTRLIDVRMNPIARRFGFHKSTLRRLCGNLGIEYWHVPELGISSEKRRSLETADDYTALFDSYEETTLREQPHSISLVESLIAERASVLVCMEADHTCCHRYRLAKDISKRTGLPMEHLGSSHG